MSKAPLKRLDHELSRTVSILNTLDLLNTLREYQASEI
jgi:hypothetical protein|tara:strand:- start:402 stop:515 length:114 start_codon:yes stop_codon:yes gene_type:complete